MYLIQIQNISIFFILFFYYRTFTHIVLNKRLEKYNKKEEINIFIKVIVTYTE